MDAKAKSNERTNHQTLIYFRAFRLDAARHLALFLGLTSVLAGCQTSEQVASEKEAQLNASYVGRPLSDFIFANGLNPVDMFDMPGGERIFIFDVPCKSWWRTHGMGAGGTPAHFIVRAVEVRGYCP